MIIDSSALVAIITNEPEAERMTRSIARAESRQVSAGSVLEASIVIEARLGEPLLFMGGDFVRADIVAAGY